MDFDTIRAPEQSGGKEWPISYLKYAAALVVMTALITYGLLEVGSRSKTTELASDVEPVAAQTEPMDPYYLNNLRDRITQVYETEVRSGED